MDEHNHECVRGGHPREAGWLCLSKYYFSCLSSHLFIYSIRTCVWARFSVLHWKSRIILNIVKTFWCNNVFVLLLFISCCFLLLLYYTPIIYLFIWIFEIFKYSNIHNRIKRQINKKANIYTMNSKTKQTNNESRI